MARQRTMPGTAQATLALVATLVGAVVAAAGFRLGSRRWNLLAAPFGALAGWGAGATDWLGVSIAVVAIAALAFGAATDARMRAIYNAPTLAALAFGIVALLVTDSPAARTWGLGALLTALPITVLAWRSSGQRVGWGDVGFAGLCGALAGPLIGPCSLILAAATVRLAGKLDDRPFALALAWSTAICLGFVALLAVFAGRIPRGL